MDDSSLSLLFAPPPVPEGRNGLGTSQRSTAHNSVLSEWVHDFTLQSTQLEHLSDERLANAEPCIFAALEEQIGLRRESQKNLADVIVTDHIERPSAN